MRPFHTPVVKTLPAIAIALLCFAALFVHPRVSAAELEWTNEDGDHPDVWMTGTAGNWRDGGAQTFFTDGDAVIFGSGTFVAAQSSTVTISSSTGVTIGASGSNPGMIITGSGNWEFVLRYSSTTSGSITVTGSSGIGISGSGAGVLMEGTGTLTFSTTTDYTGETKVDAGTLRLNVADAIAKSSGVILSSSGTLDLGGNNQTLSALHVSQDASIKFNSADANYARLTLGALTGTGASFELRVNPGASLSDRIVLTGSSEGAHTLTFKKYGDTAEQDDISVLVVEDNAGGGATFSGTLGTGVFDYQVERGANGNWYLNNTNLLSRITAAVIVSAAVAGQDWHHGLDALYKRMGELREPPTGGAASLWFRASAARTNASPELAGGHAFHQYSYGATVGADKAFHAGDATWFLGAFGSMNRVERDFDNGGDGGTDTAGGGLYITWTHATGWFADLIGRMDRNKNDINAITTDGYLSTARYDNKIKGLSLEFGRRMFWNEEWWIEPALQFAAADIGGANYQAHTADQASPDVNVNAEKARATQSRVSLRFGETGGTNPGWHPYAKIAFAYSSTRDGGVRVNNRPFAADFDGWRWEAGFGAAYVINARSQVYYDYEYAHATHYSRPWSVNLGYRFAW
jgi:outer membrane autotransporter protein